MEGRVEFFELRVVCPSFGRVPVPIASANDSKTLELEAFDCDLASYFEIWHVEQKADGTPVNEYQTGTWRTSPNKKAEQRKRIAELEDTIVDLFEELAELVAVKRTKF